MASPSPLAPSRLLLRCSCLAATLVGSRTANAFAFSPPCAVPSPVARGSSLRRRVADGRDEGDGDERRRRGRRRADARMKRGKALRSSDADDDGVGGFREADVAGVSVSPSGFLVVLRSRGEEKTVAFPVLLTSSPDGNNDEISRDNDDKQNGTNGNASLAGVVLPELFRENNDQTSVTSPEALTFLQLLNKVDMATPVLPPDTLSLICVYYAFLLLEQEFELDDGSYDDGDSDGGVIEMEDELGLLSGAGDSRENVGNDDEEALNYIRAMVRTTLPPSSDGSYFLSYLDASPWQRARIKLPRAWLRGVRLEKFPLESNDGDRRDDTDIDIGRVPIRMTLECSVDDGSKMLEVPLFTVPSSFQPTLTATASPRQRQQIDISNDILQELSQGFSGETSAAFMSLALFHRYNRSGPGSADSPVLKVSDQLLDQVEELQQKDKKTRYCWAVDDGSGDNVDAIIRNAGLPLYRTLSQIMEEDQRVLRHLGRQNFGRDPIPNIGNSNDIADDGRGSENNSQQRPQRKKSLTLEQQVLQQRLKSAWKVAMQREDEGALEKIREAMEELEREVTQEEDEEEESSLGKIQRAMREGGDDAGKEEDLVGLISELEELTTSCMMTDAEEGDVESEDEERDDKQS